MVGSAVGQYGVMVEGPGPGGAWGFPGSNTTHSYRIWNTGNYTDTFDLNATSESGWMVMIPSDITLGPGEAQWVDVRVHIPDGTLAYTADDLTVRAVSRSAPVLDTNVSVTRVYRMADVQISTTESPSGEPGENLTVLFTIRNRGNYDDNFTLTVSAEDTAYRNWTVSAPRRTADIAPSGERQIAVEVWIPRSTAEDIIAANTYATVKLTAMSAWDPHIEASGYANVRVRESRDVDLRIVGNETVDVQAGDTAEFVIEVTNAANHQSTDTFDLHVSTEQSDWLTIVQPNRVTLANGESTRVVLKATPPEDSEYRRCEMYVTATSSADPDRWRQVTAIALLPQRFGVDVTPLEPVLQQGRPLDILQFRFNVENQGNDADTFSLYANTTHGWATEVNRTVRLEFRGHEVVVVNVTVQAGTPTGTNEKLFLRARAGDGMTQDTAYATIEVLQGYAVDLEPQTNSTNAVPGEVKVMNLVLTNTGNGIDTFDLRVTSNVTASVDRTAVENLRASEQVPLRLTVQIPEGTPAGTIIHTYVNATSRADPAATDEADAVITISQVAGVSVRNAETAHGDPGGMTTLNFTVENAGNGADTFTLAATSQSDWDLVIINPDGAEDMEAGEQRVIQVRVLIPFGLEAGLEEKITLVATSELDTKVSDEGSGICRINLVTGVSVTGRDTSFKIIPGNTLFVPVYVENTGNGREEIHIEVTSSRPGWNAWARETALSLAMGESVSVDIGIEPPSGSFSTSSSIRVAASVIVDNRTVDTDTEYLDASASFVMPVERPFIYLFPGSTGSFMVRVQNLWETDTNVTIDFTPMHGWNISLDQAPTFIAPGRSEVFAVRVTAPVSLIHL
ncbi:MAG TPA: hypothetical protein EYP43_00625, partial [Thermoplasmata archaeon]|nr:hypothetical protein [Thermoplasmata archaeon]